MSSSMFARISTFEGSPETIDEQITVGQERIIPGVEKLAGFKGMQFLVDRETGKTLAVTLWESEEAMRASEQPATQLRDDGAEHGGSRITSVERYEVAIQQMR